MSQVEFDEQNIDSYRSYDQPKGVMIKIVESFGVPEEYVNFVLVGLAVVIFIIAGLVFYKFNANPGPVLPSNANSTVPGVI